MIFRTACYSIKQHSKLLFGCCKKKQKLQCNGLTSKHSNSFFIVFIVWRQFLFCFCDINFDVSTIFSKLSNLYKQNVCFKWKYCRVQNIYQIGIKATNTGDVVLMCGLSFDCLNLRLNCPKHRLLLWYNQTYIRNFSSLWCLFYVKI